MLLVHSGIYLLVALDLVCYMPHGYPEESPPEVTIDIKKGIGDKQKPELEALIQTHAEENMGSASMYIIAEAIREWLVDNNVEGQVVVVVVVLQFFITGCVFS
jgi:hypothetical protein